MFRTVLATLVATSLVAGGSAVANEKIKVGDPAPVYKDLPGVDGKNHALTDLKDKDVIVLVITCNSCPVAVQYEPRIMEFARKYAGPESKVALVAINVNREPADRLDKMKERAEEKGFRFPYLFDETQKIARDLGAQYTPEFFVLDRERKVAYLGAMDDRSSNPTVRYLEEAVEAILKGEKPAKAETRARGCLVKYARKRK